MLERRGDEPGFRVLRPFSHVLTPNESLGAPSWSALEGILVDCGWFGEGPIDAIPVRTSAVEQMFEDPVELRGVLRDAPQVTDAPWSSLREIPDDSGGPPYGAEPVEGVVLVLEAASAAPSK